MCPSFFCILYQVQKIKTTAQNLPGDMGPSLTVLVFNLTGMIDTCEG